MWTGASRPLADPCRIAWQDLALQSPRHPKHLSLGHEGLSRNTSSPFRNGPRSVGGSPCFFGSCGPVPGETWAHALLSGVPCHKERVSVSFLCPSFVGLSSGAPGEARGLVSPAVTRLAVFSCRNGSVGSSSFTSTGCCATPSTRW